METGVRDLRDNLSRYIRLAESGERVVVKAHGRIAAELVAPSSVRAVDSGELEPLIASGLITPPAEDGDPLEDCPDIRLPPGTASALIDSDRDETSSENRVAAGADELPGTVVHDPTRPIANRPQLDKLPHIFSFRAMNPVHSSH